MRCILVFLSIALEVVVTNGAVNYCGARMCGHSNAHTFCKYRPGPSPTCTGYMEAQLSAEEKAQVLARLNRRRSEMALGWRHWPPAGDMLKLRWIEELSREAQRWADQCRPPRSPEERDVCRDLYSISVGQCVSSIVGEAPGLRPESMVDMWFMQSILYDGNVTSYIPARIKNYYEDFAQMMWSRTFLVGCGRSRFMNGVDVYEAWSVSFVTLRLGVLCPLVLSGLRLTRLQYALRGLTLTRFLASVLIVSIAVLPFTCCQIFVTYLSVQDNYLLETVHEIEKNESLEYFGSLDELYLTKIAIATIGTPGPVIPLYYFLRKRDVFEQSGVDNESWKVGDKDKVVHNGISTGQIISAEKPVLRTKIHKTNGNTIGRPKSYDINELNDAIWEQKINNLIDSQDLPKSKERDLYAEYGLVKIEEDDINSTTTLGVLIQPINYVPDNMTEVKAEQNGFVDMINTVTDGVVGSERYFVNSMEEINESLIGNKSVDDYLSDPDTVRALQDALDQMERTLASLGPVSTPGKVRRELRKIADLQKIASTEVYEVVTATTENKSKVLKAEESSKSKDRDPMLSMVLKYMPYLKPYENSIVSDAYSSCDVVRIRYDISVVVYSFLLRVFVL